MSGMNGGGGKGGGADSWSLGIAIGDEAMAERAAQLYGGLW